MLCVRSVTSTSSVPYSASLTQTLIRLPSWLIEEELNVAKSVAKLPHCMISSVDLTNLMKATCSRSLSVDEKAKPRRSS